MVSAAAKLEPLTVGYSNFTGTYAPLWVAVDENLGAKYGLDLKAIYAGRIRPQQLLATGEVPVVLATATGTITSHILGVKDQVLVATITNKVGTALFARTEIKSVEDLKGKTIATGRPGAFLDATVRYVLRSKFNLVPDRDVKLLPTGEPYLRSHCYGAWATLAGHAGDWSADRHALIASENRRSLLSAPAAENRRRGNDT
jgi:ABC-type nitrate/sulfonate/bicarbonate transport system substrate-binding protein